MITQTCEGCPFDVESFACLRTEGECCPKGQAVQKETEHLDPVNFEAAETD